MSRIALICTGGTIASAVRADGMIGSVEHPAELLSGYDRDLFTIYEPCRILSENLNGEALSLMADCVDGILKEGRVQGIILTHGTDTLSYTAAYLQILFADSPVPIVLVSSRSVLSDPDENGRANFAGAINLILGNDGGGSMLPGGVYVSYQNRDERIHIIRGAQVDRHLTCSDEVFGVGGELGSFRIEDCGRMKLCDSLIWEPSSDGPCVDAENPVLRETAERVRAHLLTLGCLCEGVLRIQCYPGMVWSLPKEQVKSVVIETYHSGTMPCDRGFLEFAEDAKRRGIRLVLVGVEPSRKQYETTAAYEAAGVIVRAGVSPAYVYMEEWVLSLTA